MKKGIVIIFVLTTLGCSNDNLGIVKSEDLRGEWIEIDTKTDTISFEILGGEEVIILKRAELTHAGPYEYKLIPNDKISIHWMLAGTNSFADYYLQLSGDKLSIGNFYSSPSGAILTFQKRK